MKSKCFQILFLRLNCLKLLTQKNLVFYFFNVFFLLVAYLKN